MTIRLAASLLMLHATVLLGYALWVGLTSAWRNETDLAQALTRFGVTLVLAWGLLNQRTWAWWVSILAGAATAVLAAISLSALWHGAGGRVPAMGGLQLAVAIVSVASVALACLLLLLPGGRRYF
jgi:hypothetical protein